MYDFFTEICGVSILALILVYILKWVLKKSGGNTDLLIKIRNICFIVMAFSVLGGIVTSPSWSNDKETPPISDTMTVTASNSSSTSESVKQIEVLHPEIQKISGTPSIGATREEFEKIHRKNVSNGETSIRYDNDDYLVEYGENGRIIMITIQLAKADNELLNMFIPSDAQNIQKDNQGSDNMILVTNIKGNSQSLLQVNPKSNGNFTFVINQDKQTGKFLGGTISAGF